jgi:hypothetical protein
MNLPGCGDAATWPSAISPRDPRWFGPDDEQIITKLAESLYEQRKCSPDWIHDAQCSFTYAESIEISRAAAIEDDAEAGRLLRLAARRVIKEGAEKDAKQAIKTGVMP